MTTPAWPQHLDALERSIASQREQLTVPDTAQVLSVPDAAPPPGLGPLPAEHRARAVRLVTELELLQDELREARDRTGRALSAARRTTRSPESPASSYVDSYG